MGQTVLRGPGLQFHFYRDYSEPGNRRSPVEEIDFVVEALDGSVIPVEVKFRTRIDAPDLRATARFLDRYGAPERFDLARVRAVGEGRRLAIYRT